MFHSIILKIYYFSQNINCILFTGPPITTTSEEKAHVNASETATGPYIMKTPPLSTYSQQLWVIAKLSTANTDGKNFDHCTILMTHCIRFVFFLYEKIIIPDEVYDKSFQVSVLIDGITLERKIEHVPIPDGGQNR